VHFTEAYLLPDLQDVSVFLGRVVENIDFYYYFFDLKSHDSLSFGDFLVCGKQQNKILKTFLSFNLLSFGWMRKVFETKVEFPISNLKFYSNHKIISTYGEVAKGRSNW